MRTDLLTPSELFLCFNRHRAPPVETGSSRRGTVPTGLNLLPSDGEAYLVNDALSPAEAERYLDRLCHINWGGREAQPALG